MITPSDKNDSLLLGFTQALLVSAVKEVWDMHSNKPTLDIQGKYNIYAVSNCSNIEEIWDLYYNESIYPYNI